MCCPVYFRAVFLLGGVLSSSESARELGSREATEADAF